MEEQSTSLQHLPLLLSSHVCACPCLSYLISFSSFCLINLFERAYDTWIIWSIYWTVHFLVETPSQSSWWSRLHAFLCVMCLIILLCSIIWISMLCQSLMAYLLIIINTYFYTVPPDLLYSLLAHLDPCQNFPLMCIVIILCCSLFFRAVMWFFILYERKISLILLPGVNVLVLYCC